MSTERVEVVLPEPTHLLIDGLMAAADALQRVSIDQSTEQGRVSSAAWWLKYLDERGFVLVADPRRPPSSLPRSTPQ